MLTQSDVQLLITEFSKVFATKVDLKQMEERANEKFAAKEDLKVFATKQDLKKFATKEDLKRLPTKEDLKNFATKKDLNKLPTKEDLKEFVKKDDLKKFATLGDLNNFPSRKDLQQVKEDLLSHISIRVTHWKLEERFEEFRQKFSNDLLQFKDDVITEIKAMREEMAAWNLRHEIHEERISCLEYYISQNKKNEKLH